MCYVNIVWELSVKVKLLSFKVCESWVSILIRWHHGCMKNESMFPVFPSSPISQNLSNLNSVHFFVTPNLPILLSSPQSAPFLLLIFLIFSATQQPPWSITPSVNAWTFFPSGLVSSYLFSLSSSCHVPTLSICLKAMHLEVGKALVLRQYRWKWLGTTNSTRFSSGYGRPKNIPLHKPNPRRSPRHKPSSLSLQNMPFLPHSTCRLFDYQTADKNPPFANLLLHNTLLQEKCYHFHHEFFSPHCRFACGFFSFHFTVNFIYPSWYWPPFLLFFFLLSVLLSFH